VCRVRELGEAAEPLIPLLADSVPRVRAAAARALAVVGEAEHAPPLRRLLADDDPQCRARTAQALRTLARRLDRDLGADER
jgi:HEAT repeat protein